MKTAPYILSLVVFREGNFWPPITLGIIDNPPPEGAGIGIFFKEDPEKFKESLDISPYGKPVQRRNRVMQKYPGPKHAYYPLKKIRCQLDR